MSLTHPSSTRLSTRDRKHPPLRFTNHAIDRFAERYGTPLTPAVMEEIRRAIDRRVGVARLGKDAQAEVWQVEIPSLGIKVWPAFVTQFRTGARVVKTFLDRDHAVRRFWLLHRRKGGGASCR